MTDDTIEVFGPNGIEVLHGDAARAHQILQGIVTAKRGIEACAMIQNLPGNAEAEPQPDTLAMLEVVSKSPLSEPHKTHVIDAIHSWIRLQKRPGKRAEWTAAEQPILAAMRTPARDPNDQRLAGLRRWVRDLRDAACRALSEPCLVQQRLAEISQVQLDEWFETVDGVPGGPLLLAEARRILKQLWPDDAFPAQAPDDKPREPR